MIVFKEQLEGECQWVDGFNLPTLMKQGWLLVAMGEEEIYESFQEQEQHEGYGANWVTKTRPCKVARFLVRKTKDNVLEELHAKLEVAKRQEETLCVTKKELEVAKKELEAVEASSAEYSATATRHYEEGRVARTALRKLEKHLGLVRKEVGEAEWRRIVGEEAGPS